MSETQCHQIVFTGHHLPQHLLGDQPLSPGCNKLCDTVNDTPQPPMSPPSTHATSSFSIVDTGLSSHSCESGPWPCLQEGDKETVSLLEGSGSSAEEASSSHGDTFCSCIPSLHTWSNARQSAATVPLSATVFFRDYVIGEMIGEGRFGSVWVCQSKATKELLACKHVSKWENPDQLMLELECLARVQQHPNILQLESIFDSHESLLIVTELCNGGDLYGHILRKKFLSETETRSLFRQLVEAVQHCHVRGIIHRDIKPENVLLQTCPTTGQTTVKLADFGLATMLGKGQITVGWVGSRPYEAPEVVNHSPYDYSADVFSLGVLLFSMLSGRWPAFSEPRKTFDQSRSFQGYMWEGVSPGVKDLIAKMLSLDPKQRPRTDDLLRHPWLVQSQPLLEKCTARSESSQASDGEVADDNPTETSRDLHLDGQEPSRKPTQAPGKQQHGCAQAEDKELFEINLARWRH